VGDTIANSVPGEAGTEAHKVTAVIVTHTDHDFVDLTIKATAEAAAKQGVKDGAKSLAKKVARKAAFGLAASAAVLGALGASHGTAQEPATKTVAAVSSATPGQNTKPAEATSDAQGAHLTTTFHHPFYDETQSAFVEGKDLKAGDVLQTPTGTAEVTGVRLYHANTTTYDLTIGSLHTYFVQAGSTPVLVHNCDAEKIAAGAKSLADDIHQSIPSPFARDVFRTTAVTAARRTDGSLVHVVSGAGRGLEKAQVDYISSLGRSDIEIATNMEGGHAEATAVHYMAQNDLTPVAGGVSRNACAPDGCEDFLGQVGAEMTGPITPGTSAKIPGQSMYVWRGHEAWTNFLAAAGYR